MVKTILVIFIGLGCSFAQAQAQLQQVVVGKTSQILLKIDQATNNTRCNLQIDIPGQVSIEKEIEGPSFEALIEFTAQQTGAINIQWKGKTKFRGLNSITGCNGSGSIQVIAGMNNEQAKEKWDKYYSQLKNPQIECIRDGMQILNIKHQSLDPTEIIVGPDDQSVKPVYSKCDSFLATKTIWTGKEQSSFPCTLNSTNTTCEGVYAERQSDGKLKSISKFEALKLHFDGKPWTTGQRESNETRAARLKQEEETKAKQAAEEEKQRQLLASPEYKRQQAEIERKRLAEEKEATVKAQREQAAAEALAKKEQAAAEAIAKKEQEEKERQAKQREEQARQERINYAKQYPYYAVISCGFNGQHINILACFAGRTGTEIELRNGNAYGLYKAHQIGSLGRESREGLTIDLRSNFELKAQNSDETLVLGVKIYNRSTNDIAFQKQVSRFGVIRISN